MTLEVLGYNTDLEKYRKSNHLETFGVARVISEHKERYVVKTAEKEFQAEIIGNLRYSAQGRTNFPAVGDWVAISEYDTQKVLIYAVFPRSTILEREAAGKSGEKQIIATNLDSAFIMQAVDRDFNLNRLERYLTICHTTRVKPIIVLTKTDLITESELNGLMLQVKQRVKEAPIVAISNETREGYENLNQWILKGKTYCLLGSSGVGKSTLVNNLSGHHTMKTNAISTSTHKGRHVTSHRELFVLENGGILIDNPGMREVGIANASSGLETTFELILDWAKKCKFKDCTHTNETGCEVIKAVESGDIDQASYENYLKMEREKTHFESTLAERRKKDKDLGKIIKHFKKTKKSNKY